LSPEEFFAAFQGLWETLTRRFFKFEGRQTYAEPGDDSFEAFRSGDVEEARRLVAERVSAQRPLYRSATSRGVQIVRVRRYELPLSRYLCEYELCGYVTGTEYGEEVLMAEASEMDGFARLVGAANLPDFLLFDDRAVLVQDYDEEGRLQGAERLEDWRNIRIYVQIASMLLDQALPLAQWVALLAPTPLEADQVPHSKVWQVEARAGSARVAWAQAELDKRSQAGQTVGSLPPGLIAALWRQSVPSAGAEAAAQQREARAKSRTSGQTDQRLRGTTVG